MNSLVQELLTHGPVLTDGSWGVHLQTLGLQPGESPDVWNITHPDRVAQVARAYVDAGSRIILTNTFGASRIMLARHGYADQVSEINQSGARISVEAARGAVKVFASIGPSGALLMMDEVTEQDLQDAFTEQARALAAGGADAIVIETMSDLTETTLAVKAAVSTGLAVVACMTFDSGKQKDRTMMGVTPEQAALALTQAGASVIGANCGQGIESYIGICERLHRSTSLPIWIKPNAGLPVVVDGKTVYNTTPEEFAAHGEMLVRAGASFIGGCCGSNPEFIRVLSRRLSQLV